MLRWFFYEDSVAGSPHDDGGRSRGGRGGRGGGEETKEAENRGQEDVSGTEMGVGPRLDYLDPHVSAAILAQAAFRGYRLRDRLRRLPAREAEKTIRALHANARGFRSLGLYLLFFGLYFSLVFGGADVAFQRSVQQGLRNHLAMVKFGPEGDRTHEDVTSLSELHQWMQTFYLKTYHGTQLESVCTACVVKPPDDICDTCNFDLYEANFPNASLWYSGSTTTSSDQSRRRAATTSSSSSSTTSVGLSEDCQACLIGRSCGYLDICAAYLASGEEEDGAIDGLSSSSASSLASLSSASNASAELTLNMTALEAIELEPEGGVTAVGDYLLVDNISHCEDFNMRVGITENLARFQANLKVPYDGVGYVADRNRIIGGMLVTFSRRNRLSVDQCSSSRGYFDICLDEGSDKETIFPGGVWGDFRPEPGIVYSDLAGGYPILIDTGGFNTGLNFGLCTLMVMEGLDIIPPEEVNTVTVQLITYNGNQKSAYGSITISFGFHDGGEVTVKETISAYVLKNNITGSGDRARWISTLIFFFIFVGMARYDTKKWWRQRRSKAKRNRCHCVCGCMFFALIFINILLWLTWAFALASTISFETEFQDTQDDTPVLDSMVQEVVALYQVALFASAYYFIFLLTTMAGLYRWIFQMLTFHKRMSIVTDTLSRASTHLDHFLFVMFLVVLVFSNLTWLLVGSSTPEFSSLDEAWRSVIRVTLGESENFYPQILAAQPTVGPVIVVLYQVLGVVLLLNVVIAVLLEAYRGVVGSMYDEDTIFQSLTAFIGMTLCLLKTRIVWSCTYVRWWLSEGRSRKDRRPSLKVALQGSTGVYGVDGRPVVMIRRPYGPTLRASERQLSYNCRRYISVTEMQALIEAAPVPAFVADRLVRKIVNNWIFRSNENNTREKRAANYSGGYGANSGSRDGSMESMPMLRRRDSQSSVPSSR